MKFQPRSRMPAGLQPFPISAYMKPEIWAKAHELVALERRTHAGFGYYVGELIRKDVEQHLEARKAQDAGGVREDLS